MFDGEGSNLQDPVGYALLEWSEKEESETEDEKDFKEESNRIDSSAFFNILGTVMKGEPRQILFNSNFSGAEAWRKLTKRYSPTTPMRGMQLPLATISPGRPKKLEDTSVSIDKWETKVVTLSRDIKETISDKMMAAILSSILLQTLQDILVPQADKITDYNTTKEKITTAVEANLALKCAHRDSNETDEYDMCKGPVHCYRCGGVGHIAANCASPTVEKGSKGNQGKTTMDAGKGYFGKDGKGGKGQDGKGGTKGETHDFVPLVVKLSMDRKIV